MTPALVQVQVLAQEEGLGETLWRGSYSILAYAALGLILFVAGFYVVDMATPGKLSQIIRTERNPNATMLTAAGMIGIGLIVAASIFAAGGRLADGLLSTLVFGAIGIVVQTIAMLAFDRLIGIDVRDLVKAPDLEPAAWLLGATHVMIGVVTAIAVI
jgi:uncharacterized membrane protein YjfL (UPF0719 family)